MKNVIYDGLNLFIGLQGFGKTYACTFKAVYELLNPDNSRKVLSNYPIIFTIYPTKFERFLNSLKTKIRISHRKSCYIKRLREYTVNIIRPEPLKEKIYSSYVWKKEYTSSPIKNSFIIIDEGHDDYTGSFAWELTKDDRRFFSRLRHNNIAVYLISQSHEDVHPFLKRRIAYIHDVSKRKLPWNKNPSSFGISTYSTVKDYIKKDDHRIHKKAKKTLYHHERIPFITLVGTAYDTHQYANTGIEPKLTSWIDELSGNIEPQPPVIEDTISTQVIKDSIATLVRLNKWKKRDATVEVNKIILEYEPSEINTVEKIIKKSLSRRAEILEDIDELETDT